MNLLDDIARWGGADRYAQHSICLTNDPLMVLLYVWGDLTTGIAYFVIGVTLMLRVWNSPQGVRLEMTMSAAGLYGAFIFLCGLSHFMEVLTLRWGIYRYDVMVTAAMAAVSAVTAVMTTQEISGRSRQRET